jgi:glycosyltransferase involved in cell wall biosynthesis
MKNTRQDTVNNICMKIGIYISQMVYEGTGVGRYVKELTTALIKHAPQHDYVLFGSSLRKKEPLIAFGETMKKLSPNVQVHIISFPPTIMDILWNTLHIIPISWFIGNVDVFWSSDWTQPPIDKKTVGITTVHDVSFLRFPESFPKGIRIVQKRRMRRAVQECSLFLCDSEITKQDLMTYYHVKNDACTVVYPGIQ